MSRSIETFRFPAAKTDALFENAPSGYQVAGHLVTPGGRQGEVRVALRGRPRGEVRAIVADLLKRIR